MVEVDRRGAEEGAGGFGGGGSAWDGAEGGLRDAQGEDNFRLSRKLLI